MRPYFQSFQALIIIDISLEPTINYITLYSTFSLKRNSRSATQKIPLLRNSHVHYRVHKCAKGPHLESYTPTPHPHIILLTSILMLSSNLRLCLSSSPFCSNLSMKLGMHLTSSTRPTHFVLHFVDHKLSGLFYIIRTWLFWSKVTLLG